MAFRNKAEAAGLLTDNESFGDDDELLLYVCSNPSSITVVCRKSPCCRRKTDLGLN